MSGGKAGGRVGDWIGVYSGEPFWPLDPRPEDVRIEDIAASLSKICRFNGHTRTFYSVAQHSVLVSSIVPPEHALWGLMHDSAEAYLCDLPKPLKRSIEGYEKAEAATLLAVCKKFGMTFQMPLAVKQADREMLAREIDALMNTKGWDYSFPELPPGVVIMPWSPERAEDEFLNRFHEIQKQAA